jgi:meckelin
MRLALLTVAVLWSARVVAQTPNQLLGVCVGGNASSYMRYGTWDCAICPLNSRFTGGRCVCDPGFAMVLNPPFGTMSCDDCASRGLAVSLVLATNGSQKCVTCGGADGAAFGLANAIFDTASKKCTCSTGTSLVQIIGTVALSGQYCAACNGHVVGGNCVSCDLPYVFAASSGSCVCAAGYATLVDGACVPQAQLSQIFSGLSAASFQLSAPNIDNSGGVGSTVTSYYISQHLAAAASSCSTGNMTACNLLANLCVLAFYAPASAPCSVYLNLLSQTGCRGLLCEDPATLPWLYYLRSGANIIHNPSTSVLATLSSRLLFVAAQFAMNGTFLGNIDFTDGFFSCDADYNTAVKFMKVGSQRSLSCFINLRWFLAAGQTVFLELFLRDPQNPSVLLPIPVLLDYSSQDINPKSFGDNSVLREAATDAFQPNPTGYRRRFYMYDNAGSASVSGGPPAFVTYARRVVLLLSISPYQSSNILTPLVVVQYASFAAGPLLSSMDLSLAVLRFQKVNKTAGDGAASASTSVIFLMDTTTMDQALMITLTVMCCLCFVSAWARTYGWMRRQQDLLVGPQSMVRFFIYLCNHLSNVFALIVFITCWYFYIFYKYQFSLQYSVPQFNAYISNLMYSAVAAKGAVVIYRLVEQCNADIFIIDWERSKGQLLREEKNASVSMWRSIFVANELNELQNLRRWSPLMCMLIIMLFLEGLQYMNLTLMVPEISFHSDPTAPSNYMLRTAISSFFWIAVCLTLYVLQYHIYYTFIAIHPLREFIDLCSVSNISVMILIEPQWGYYIHGESIHAHADVSMVEFQENLQREARGDLPSRGLGGQDQCQTFEVFLGSYMRNYLYVCQAELMREHQMSATGAAPPMVPGRQMTVLRSVQQMIRGTPDVFSVQTIHIKNQRNQALMQSVRSAEKSLLGKFGLHALLDFPPNIMYMNGPFAGENTGRDMYFFDDAHHYGEALMFGMDFDIFLLYVLLFAAIDSSLQNTYVSMIIVYCLEVVLAWYRSTEGESNVAIKSMIDQRFMI